MSPRTVDPAVRAQVLRFVRMLWADGDVRELRVLRHNRYNHTAAGWFDTPEKLVDAALAWDGLTNLFLTLNAVDRSLLGLANNRMDTAARTTTTDDDIVCRSWLVIDADPRRKSGISSTDAELAASLQVLQLVIAFLRSCGWPAPVLIMSGNGHWALYRIDLPNEAGALQLVGGALDELAARFDTAEVAIDTTLRNAARIIGLTGTLKVKGDPLPDRPHRRSTLLEVPETLVPVSAELLQAVAGPLTEPACSNSDRMRPPPARGTASGSLARLLASAGIEVQERPADALGITWYHPRRCPFHEDGPDYECGVGQQLPDGPLAGHCFHNRGRGKGWQEWKIALGLGMPRVAPDTAIDDLAAARSLVSAALLQLPNDPGVLYNPETLGALALVQRQDPAEFARVRQACQKAHLALRPLEAALRAVVPLHPVAETDEPAERTAGSMLLDAPLPDLLVPRPYFLEEGRTGLVDRSGPVPEEITIAHAPLLLTARLEDVDDGSIFLRTVWKRPQRWYEATIDRGTALDARALTALAGQGLPVTSDNARSLVRYIDAVEAANYATLPVARVSGHLGWQGEHGEHGFLWGRDLILPDGERAGAVRADGALDDWREDWIAFQAGSPGDEQIADAYHVAGSWDGWCEAVAPVTHLPRVLAGFYTSFVPPLLTILGAPNFVLDFANRTSTGKTTVQRLAASVWGRPDEKAPDGALHSWDATRVWLERSSAVLSGLPLILDDTKLAKDPKLVAEMLYAVANGRGRGRGTVRGLARTRTWHTVLISSGEAPAVSYTQDGGTRMRCLTLRGSPFGGAGTESGALVLNLNQALLQHYGQAGPRFIQWLLCNRASWPEWAEQYRRRVREFAGCANSAEAGRLAQYVAAIDVAATLVHQALPLPWENINVTFTLWSEIAAQATDAAGEVRALQDVMSWAYSNSESFWGRAAPSSTDGNVRVPPKGWAGVWKDSEAWTTIAFLPGVLKEVLGRLGYQPEAILAGWQERGWLDAEEDRRHPYTRRVGFNRERPWCIVLSREAVDEAGA